jgi:predicted ATPase
VKYVLLLPNNGLILDRFKILRQLGKGNMGVVYEAEDTEIGVNVALKVLSESSAAGIYRLKQEFRAIANVVHPNLVGLHELFSVDDIWFFTMDLVEGDTLLNQLGRKPNLARLKLVFSQLAAGIRVIHNTGKLHRDIKPNNVLLTPDDRVVILDFGLASDAEMGGVGQTLVEDGVSGTPAYMAPELMTGVGVSRAGDWYSFGVMLFEALTGRLPFEGNIREVLTFKALYDPPPISSLVNDVPDDLDALCTRLLSRDPAQRPGYDEVISVLGNTSKGSKAPLPTEDLPFVGRGEETASLREALEMTHLGKPCVAMVSGPSGVGKSTLIENFMSELRRSGEAVVLSGRCFEREWVPFKGCDSLIDSLTHYLRQLPARQAAQMMPRQILALARIFPVFNRLDVVKHTKLRYPLPPNPNELRRMAFLAAKELLANIAAQEPLVIFVDDLQWIDVDGARLLSSFFFQPDAPLMLLVVSLRSEDARASRGLAAFLSNIKEVLDLEVREINLKELSEENSEALAHRILPSQKQDLAPFVAKESRGNPFFISTLARFIESSSESEAAPSLENAVRRRLALLSDREKEIMETICVSVRPIDSALLKSVVTDHNTAEVLRSLSAERLIRQTGDMGGIAAYHDRIRETVVAGMSPEHLMDRHRKLAQALERSESEDPVRLTEHWLGGGDLKRAGMFASKAARHAEEALAFENAARFYKIAIEHNPGDRDEHRALETARGEALANAGRRSDAAEAFMRASKDAKGEEALELKRRAAQQWLNTGRMDQGTKVLDTVLRTLGMKLSKNHWSALFETVVNRTALKFRGFHFKEQPASSASKRDLLKLNICEDIMIGMWAAAPHLCAEYCSKYLRSALNLGIVASVVKGLSTEAIALSFGGTKSRAKADDLLARAQELGKKVSDPEILAYLNLAMGLAVIAQGDYLKAAEYLKRTENICLKECTRKTANLEIAQSFLGAAYTRLGKWRQLQEDWDRWTETARELGNLHQLTICHTWPMGVCRRLASDQVDAARRQLQQGIDGWSWPAFDLQRVYAQVSESYIHLYTGDFDKAFAVYPPLWEKVRKTGLHRIQVHRILYTYNFAQCAVSLASVSDKRSEKFSSLLQIADARANELDKEHSFVAAPFVAAVKGTIAALRGDTNSAQDLLTSAIHEFDKLEYKLYAAAVRMQLGRLLEGDNGAALIASGEAAMKEENIVDPLRISSVLAPTISV